MDLGELSDVFEHLGSTVSSFRAVGTLPSDLGDYVYLAAVGPFEISTCTDLVPASALPIWDVNGYYRAIGITRPYRPSRKQMRESYRDTGGPGDPYATYAFKRLLDREFRQRYDRRKLGEPMDDDYRFAAMFQMLADMAARQSRLTGRTVTYRDLLGEDLMDKMSRQAEAERQVQDVEAARDLREDGTEHDRPQAEEQFVWPYAYFLWSSRKYDDTTLSQWQRMLHEAFVREGLSVQMAVGYFGATSGAATARVRHPQPGGGHTEILFLHEEAEPSQELAEIVVGTYHTHPHGTEHDPLCR